MGGLDAHPLFADYGAPDVRKATTRILRAAADLAENSDPGAAARLAAASCVDVRRSIAITSQAEHLEALWHAVGATAVERNGLTWRYLPHRQRTTDSKMAEYIRSLAHLSAGWCGD